MFVTIAFDVIVAALILYRQRRIRPVPRILHLRLPIVLGVIGIVEVLDYIDGHHHVSSGAVWLVIAVTVLGAGVLGAVRALTVKIWESHNWIVRQGTWLTMALWLFSLLLHLAISFGASTANLEASTFLLYVALTLGVQAYVVHLRALPLWDALGPGAGRGFQVSFGTGPNSFFGGFGNIGNIGQAGQPFRDDRRYDPTIIDAEVVEDEDPPELR